MKKERTTGMLVCALFFIFLLSGCIHPEQPNEVVVGALLPLSGNLSYSGQAAQVGLDAAVEDVNAYFADTGVKARLIIEDDESNPAVALAKIKKLKEMGVKFVIGPDSSAAVEAVRPYANENGIILISHGSTAASLSIPSDNVFRLLPDDTNQAEAMANLMLDDGVKEIVPVWRGDVWGDGLYEATKTRFEGPGGIVLDGVRYSPETDFSNELEPLRSKVDRAVSEYGRDRVAVYFLGFGEAGTFFKRVANTSVSNVKWYGSDGTALDNNLINDREAARFAVKTRFSNPSFSIENKEKYRRLEEKAKARVGMSYLYAFTAYDALWLSTLTYIASNKSSDVNILKKTLVNTASSYDGATGLIMLNDAGDRKFASYDFWMINETNGTFAWERVANYQTNVSPILRELDNNITIVLDKMDEDLSRAAHELSRTDLQSADARKIIRDLCNSNPDVVDCAIIDRNGSMLAIEPAQYRKFEGSNISEQDQMVRLLEGKPVLSKVFKSIEGFDAVDLEYPILSPGEKLIGSVSFLFMPESMFSGIVSPLHLQSDVWIMQRDGRILYDPDTEEIGRMLFDDPLYKPYPQLLALGRRIASERTGSGSYEFQAMGLEEPVRKEAEWSTVGLHGTEWRLVATRVQNEMILLVENSTLIVPMTDILRQRHNI